MDASLTFNSETLNTKVEFLVFFKSCHCFDFVHVTCFGLLFHFIFFVASSLIAFLCFSCMFKSVESDQKCQNVLLMQSLSLECQQLPLLLVFLQSLLHVFAQLFLLITLVLQLTDLRLVEGLAKRTVGDSINFVSPLGMEAGKETPSPLISTPFKPQL